MPFVAADAEVLISPPSAARWAVAARNARLLTGVPTELLGHIYLNCMMNGFVPFMAADAEVLISPLRAARRAVAARNAHLLTGVPTELLGQTYFCRRRRLPKTRPNEVVVFWRGGAAEWTSFGRRPKRGICSPHRRSGRDGWTRTSECGSQSPVPYRLATPLYRGFR